MEPAVKYRLIHQDKHSGARLGELITPHGTFPTPMFMPVEPKPASKQWRQRNWTQWEQRLF